MQKRNKIYILILFAIFPLGQIIKAQSNTLYFMDGIHQSGSLNPAYQNSCNGFLALPGINGFSVDAANTGFDFNDLIHLGTGTYKDSLVIDFQNIKSKLANSNSLLVGTQVPILGIGFWVRNSYITFEISNKTKARLAYPEDLIKITDGNANYIGVDNPLEIKGFGPNIINYNEFALGFSKQITHRLIVGGKLKFLAGNASIESRRGELKLFTEEDTYKMTLVTDLQLNVSGPINYIYDANGNISDFEFDDSNIAGSIISTKNVGMGIDLGASYLLNDEIKIYASVTDLGFINWRANTSNLSQSGSFVFSGFNLDSVWTDSDYDEAQAIVDSISDFFSFAQTESKYTTFLNTNIFLGATYELTNFMNVGLLSKTYFYNRKVHQAFTLSANFKPAKWFTGTLSYSVMNREYKNIGLGMGIKTGPVQFYLLTDYLNAAFWPKNSKAAGFQFGLNFYFGCGKRDNFSMLKDKKSQKEIDFM